VSASSKGPRRSVGEGAIYETADGRMRGSVLVLPAALFGDDSAELR
jgi:hypothetical protein